MDLVKIITVVIICLGLVALLWATLKTSKILKVMDGTPNAKVWLLLRFLMVVFIVGYAFALNLVWYDKTEPMKLIFGFVFLFGALFVLLVVIVTTNDLHFMNKSKLSLRRKNQQLEKVNSELDMFVYSTAHDLRSPLVSILGLVHLAEKTHEVEEKMQCLEMVKGRIDAMDHFIQSIIQFSSNSKLPVKFKLISARECLDELHKEFELINHSHNVRIEFVSNDFTFFSDSGRLKIILTNLISNAIRYHDPLVIILM